MLLQNFDDVERLARALQQQENGALEAAAAAQLRYVALREQMAAREQELVDEMLRKANAEHSDAAAAQTQLEQELQAKKLELKALEERDREEAKEKGLGKVVRSQSTKDAYWEEAKRQQREHEERERQQEESRRELEEEEKRKQAEKHKQEQALRVGAEASSHARTAFASLELLGTAYQALRDQRSEPGGCRGDVGVFVRLVDILRQHQAHRRLAEELEDAAKSAQDRAAELRGELRRTQQEIQNDVAGSHERLGQQKIEDMQDLPCEVKQKIHNRDLKRSRIAKELRTVLCKLHDTLQTATGIALL